MEAAEKKEEIVLIDKLSPALTGKNPRERLALFFCLSIAGFFSTGLAIGYNWGSDILNGPDPIYRMIMLALIIIVCAAITLLSTLIFIKTFQKLLTSLDSKKESQQAKRAAQQKSR